MDLHADSLVRNFGSSARDHSEFDHIYIYIIDYIISSPYMRHKTKATQNPSKINEIFLNRE